MDSDWKIAFSMPSEREISDETKLIGNNYMTWKKSLKISLNYSAGGRFLIFKKIIDTSTGIGYWF